MASLKEQLDQAGYDTSTLDEAAVLKQLNDEGYDTSSFAASAPLSKEDQIMQDNLKGLDNQGPLDELKGAFDLGGKLVKGGISGIAELDKAILPRMANHFPPIAVAQGLGMMDKFEEPEMKPTILQAGDNVNRVMAGERPTSSVGRTGETVGSFFTPGQIALQAVGGKLAPMAVKGVAKGINAVGEMLAPASEAALPGGAKAIGNALSTMSGLDNAALETVMTNPEGVAAAKTFPGLAEDVAGSMNKLKGHLDKLETAANGVLNAKKSMNVSVMTDAIENEVKSINLADVTTPEMESAKKVLEGMLSKIKNRGTMSEPEVAKWIKEVQGKVNFKNTGATELNESLTRIQSTVNEALKDQNPAYKKAIGEFADAVNLKKDVSKAMGIEREPGMAGGYEPANVSVAKLKGLLHPDSAIATKKLLNNFANVPGVPNYVDMAANSSAKAATQSGARARLAGFLAGIVPGAGNALKTAGSATLKALPAFGNAVYQGLRD